MSLINEALRKVQSQRAQAPELGADSRTGNPSINYTARPSRFGLMIGLSLLIIVLLGLIAGLTFVLLSKGTTQSTPQTAATEPEAPVAKTAAEPSTVTDPVKPKTEISETVSHEPAAPTPEVAEAPMAEPNPAIVDWLAQSKITGVRITSSNSKVILNDKGFSPGDNVNPALGLKIFEIEPKRIILIDSNEVQYVKLF